MKNFPESPKYWASESVNFIKILGHFSIKSTFCQVMHTTTAITTTLKVGICGLFWNKSTLNPNWTGQIRLVYHQNLSFFGESWHQSLFSKIVVNLLRIMKKGHRGRWKWSSIFQATHPSQKNMLPKANDQRKKKTICQIFHQNESESFDENWKNGGKFCVTCTFDFRAT